MDLSDLRCLLQVFWMCNDTEQWFNGLWWRLFNVEGLDEGFQGFFEVNKLKDEDGFM